MTTLSELSLVEAADLVRTHSVSPVEIVTEAVERAGNLNGGLNCLVSLADDAVAQARRAEREVMRGRYRGSLHGIPVALKDNLLTRDIKTTGGSLVLDDWRPLAANRDATVVSRLRRAGAVILGKTNLYELAYGFPHPAFGSVTNPVAPGHTTGGSSNGSAAAVAAQLCYAAIGTDTGGSIRVPAAFCGLVGVKPSLGRVGRGGIIPLSTTLDCVGPLTRRVTDAAVVLDAISGPDRTDPATSRRRVQSTWAELQAGVAGLRIGWLEPSISARESETIAEATRKAVSLLADLGAQVVEVAVPSLAEGRRLNGVIAAVEAAEFHQRLLRERPSGYSLPVRRRLQAGSLISGADYIRAQRARLGLVRKHAALFAQVDAIVLPTILIEPPPIEDWMNVLGRAAGSTDDAGLVEVITRYTSLWNVTGESAVVVPLGSGSGPVPASLQIVAPALADGTALRIASVLEQAGRPSRFADGPR